MDTSANTRVLALTAMLITMAAVLHIVEAMLPTEFIFFIPGAKLGLANIVTVAALVAFGPKIALAVAVGRTVLGGITFTGIVSVGFAMSFSGAILSWLVMALLHRLGKESFSLVGISLAGAVAHNLAQLTVASLVLEEAAVFTLFPWLMFFAVPTGIMVGLSATLLVRNLEKLMGGRRWH